MVSHWRGWVVVIVVLLCAGTGHAADMHGVVDSFLAKYQASGKTWEVTISNAATSVFWILAMISMGWTCISMG